MNNVVISEQNISVYKCEKMKKKILEQCCIVRKSIQWLYIFDLSTFQSELSLGCILSFPHIPAVHAAFLLAFPQQLVWRWYGNKWAENNEASNHFNALLRAGFLYLVFHLRKPNRIGLTPIKTCLSFWSVILVKEFNHCMKFLVHNSGIGFWRCKDHP